MPILESPIKIPMKLEVTPDGIKMGLGNQVMPRTVIVDDELSLESENPVQNKVITAALNEKVDSEGAAAAAPVQSVSGKTGDVELVKSDVGLGNVDNTSDLDKPVSTAQAQALDGKLSKTGGSMTGPIAMGGNKITGLQQGTADTDAVNVAQMASAISQGAAYFRGSFATKADLMAVAWQTSDPEASNYVTNNDYAIVLADETHSNECWRYLYVSGDGWTAQYRINESPFTQAQLDAINSGATQALISAIPGKQDALTFDTEPTYNSTNPVTSDGIHAALDEKTTYEDLYDVYPLMYSAGSENEFVDGADDVPFESFKVTINPVQNGSGIPSPTNVRAISGWTEVGVYHETEETDDNDNPNEYVIDLAPYVPDGVVYSGVLDLINWKLTVDRVAVDLGSLDWSKTGTKFYHPWDSDDPLRPDANLTPGSVGKAANALCSQYEASSYTALATKDYGFTLYKTLGKGRVYVTDSRYSTTDAFKAGVNGVTLVYPLAEPIVYDISDYNYEFKSAYGLNIITATTGDNEVGYRAALELILAKTDQNFASVEPIKRASKNYSYGDLIVVQHRLYRAISSIANKQSLVPGVNISETNVEQEFANHEKIAYVTTDATYNEVRSILVQHEPVALIDGNVLYFCTDHDISNDRFVFTAIKEEKVTLAYLDTNNNWTYGTKLLADSFFATYNVTTFAEIADAVSDGKIVYCKMGTSSKEYYVLGIEEVSSEYNFYGFRNSAIQTVTCDYEDHWTSSAVSIPQPATVAPRALGTAAVGTSTKYAKEDHVHRLPTASEVGAYELPSGGIPKTDLVSGVQSSLDLADSAYQKPSGGIPATDLASGVIPTVPSASSATPQDLGTADAGSSNDYSRADHVHNKPTYTASDVGAVASDQGVANAGKFLVVDNDGVVTPVTMTTWQGGSY